MATDMTTPDPMPLIEMISQFRKSKSLFTAVNLGIFDALESGPKPVRKLAEQLKLNESALEQLLNACVMMGLLERNENWYVNTKLATIYLTKNSPDRLIGYINYSDAVLWKMWDNLAGAIREGTHRWKQTYGADGPIFSQFFKTEESKREFLSGMHGYGRISSPMLMNLIDLSQHQVFVDLGGGTGHLAQAAVQRWSNLSAVVFDLPEVLNVTKDFLLEHDRIRLAPGDFFKDPLPAGDVMALGRILHDWNEVKIIKLLDQIYQALPKGGRLLIGEKLLTEDKSGPEWAVLQSINMLVCTEGKERTMEEYAALLKNVGFKSIEAYRTNGPLDLVSAIKQ